ncbi:hypothetical protein ACFLWS_03980 [Chloroflexota bacterium]
MKAEYRKASGIKTIWMRRAKQFCKEYRLEYEYSIIEDMDRPASWNLKKGGNGNKPTWLYNSAVQGNLVRLWDCRYYLTRPVGWKDQPRFSKALDEYLKTPEGKSWLSRNKPGWLTDPRPAPKLSPVTTSLSFEDKLLLRIFADECGTDMPTLLRIWIVERLHPLR